MTSSRPVRLGRAAAVLAATTAALLASGGVASADTPGPAAAGLIGDVNLLNNLNVCGVTAGLGLGNLLGLLGEGTANPVTNGGDVACVINPGPDRPDAPAGEPDV